MPGAQEILSVVISSVSPPTAQPQSPCRRCRVWYLCVQTEFMKEEEEWREMRASTEKSEQEIDGPW